MQHACASRFMSTHLCSGSQVCLAVTSQAHPLFTCRCSACVDTVYTFHNEYRHSSGCMLCSCQGLKWSSALAEAKEEQEEEQQEDEEEEEHKAAVADNNLSLGGLDSAGRYTPMGKLASPWPQQQLQIQLQAQVQPRQLEALPDEVLHLWSGPERDATQGTSSADEATRSAELRSSIPQEQSRRGRRRAFKARPPVRLRRLPSNLPEQLPSAAGEGEQPGAQLLFESSGAAGQRAAAAVPADAAAAAAAAAGLPGAPAAVARSVPESVVAEACLACAQSIAREAAARAAALSPVRLPALEEGASPSFVLEAASAAVARLGESMHWLRDEDLAAAMQRLTAAARAGPALRAAAGGRVAAAYAALCAAAAPDRVEQQDVVGAVRAVTRAVQYL